MTDLEQHLLRLEFSRYEAKVLAALLREKVASATILSKVSQVPRTRIYDVLNKLIQKGWVVKRPGRPAMYEVVKPEALIQDKIREKREKLEKTEEELNQILEDIEEEREEGKENEVSELILGTENSINTIRSLILGAESFLMFEQIPFDFMNNFKNELKELKKKNVDVKILARPEDKKKIRKFRRMAEIRIVKPEFKEKVGMFVSDDSVLHVYSSGTRFDCVKITFPRCISCIKNQIINELWKISPSL